MKKIHRNMPPWHNSKAVAGEYADHLVFLLGKGWKKRVHHNLHWYYTGDYPPRGPGGGGDGGGGGPTGPYFCAWKGPAVVYPRWENRQLTYYCMISSSLGTIPVGGSGYWTRHDGKCFKDPWDAVRKAAGLVEEFFEGLQPVRDAVRKIVSSP